MGAPPSVALGPYLGSDASLETGEMWREKQNAAQGCQQAKEAGSRVAFEPEAKVEIPIFIHFAPAKICISLHWE